MDPQSFAREIETHIRPATFSVAVKLLTYELERIWAAEETRT